MPSRSGDDDLNPGLSRLPPGRHGLPREVVAKNQKDRLTAGVIAAVAERGYHGATITAIAAAASMSRRTFYAYFDSKEACFLSAYEAIADHLREVAAGAAEKDGSAEWPAQVKRKLAAVLEVLAANPDLVRFFLVAPARAGAELGECHRRSLHDSLDILTDGMPPPPETRQPSEAVQQAMVGGAVGLIVSLVEEGNGERLPELLPELTELVLAPFLGREQAADWARDA